MIVALVLMAVLLTLVRPIVSIMSTPAEAVDGTVAYLRICFIGIPFITAYNIISSIFRGMGDSKSPMCFIAVACVAILFWIMCSSGAEAWPAGAALGTTVAQAISVGIALTVIIRKQSIVLGRQDFQTEKKGDGKNSVDWLQSPVRMDSFR